MILRNVEILGHPGVQDVMIEGRAIRKIVSCVEGNVSGIDCIDFSGALAFPGLINSHDHLEFNCYEQLAGGPYRDYIEWGKAIHSRHAAVIAKVEAVPRPLRVRAGIAKNVLCGVTSVAHHGPALQIPRVPIHVMEGTKTIHSPRLGRMHSMLIPGRSVVVAHVGEGVDREAEREIDSFIRWNLWRRKIIGVHAIAMRAEQAERFAALVWCPVSNEHLFGRSAPIAMLKNHASILFGTDSTLTAPWNIWEHLRRARELGGLSDDELIAAVTETAAKVWNLLGRGKLAPSAVADVVVVRKRHSDPRDAFFAINPEDILLVVASGVVVLIDASLQSQLHGVSTFFRTMVNGVEKWTLENYSELARELQGFLPPIPYLTPA